MNDERDPFAREFREALGRDAARIQPSDRLDSILAAARDESAGAVVSLKPGGSGGGAGRGPGGRSGPSRWLPVAAAAAAVLAIGVGVAWVNSPRSNPIVAGPTTTTSASVSAPSSPGLTAVNPTSGGNLGTTSLATETAPNPDVTEKALALYRVRPSTVQPGTYLLEREYIRASVPTDPAGTVLTALRAAVTVPGPAYATTWSAEDIISVEASGAGYVVGLARGLPDVTTEQGRVAVTALVTTAQAALGSATVPITFVVDRSGEVVPGVASGTPVPRPASAALEDMSFPIWVGDPYNGQVFTVGSPITIAGSANVFEANLQWAVTRGTTTVRQSFTTATSGSGVRGTFTTSVTLPEPGVYTISVWSQSAEDGSRQFQVTRQVTVR